MAAYGGDCKHKNSVLFKAMKEINRHQNKKGTAWKQKQSFPEKLGLWLINFLMTPLQETVHSEL